MAEGAAEGFAAAEDGQEVPVVGTQEVFQQQQALVGEGVEAGVVFPVDVDL